MSPGNHLGELSTVLSTSGGGEGSRVSQAHGAGGCVLWRTERDVSEWRAVPCQMQGLAVQAAV